MATLTNVKSTSINAIWQNADAIAMHTVALNTPANSSDNTADFRIILGEQYKDIPII